MLKFMLGTVSARKVKERLLRRDANFLLCCRATAHISVFKEHESITWKFEMKRNKFRFQVSRRLNIIINNANVKMGKQRCASLQWGGIKHKADPPSHDAVCV